MELTITALSLAVIFLVSAIIIIVTRKPQDWIAEGFVKKTEELEYANSQLKDAMSAIRGYSLEQSEIYLYLRSQGIASRHEPDDMHDYPYPRPLLECVKELAERVGK